MYCRVVLLMCVVVRLMWWCDLKLLLGCGWVQHSVLKSIRLNPPLALIYTSGCPYVGQQPISIYQHSIPSFTHTLMRSNFLYIGHSQDEFLHAADVCKHTQKNIPVVFMTVKQSSNVKQCTQVTIETTQNIM